MYRANITKYKEDLLEKTGDKHTLLFDYFRGVLNTKVIDDYINAVELKRGDGDFYIISLIRLICSVRNEKSNKSRGAFPFDSEAICTRIDKCLLKYPFWPHDDGLEGFPADLVFWSENHLLMLLTSSHLVRQLISDGKCNEPRDSPGLHKGFDKISSPQSGQLEESLLELYLHAHVLSHVYLPFSLCALLNLVDFSNNKSIAQLAKTLADKIVAHLMLCTTDQGVGNLSASCRSFERTRVRTHDHNVNTLIYLITGKSAERDLPLSSLTDFLVATEWEPPESATQAYVFSGFQHLKMNHSVDAARIFYGTEFASAVGVSMALGGDEGGGEIVPFFWSAGLILHPDFARETKAYQRRKRLTHNVHLWPLALFSPGVTEYLSSRYKFLSEGQSYLGVYLNVYKRPCGLCLSSFERFNGGVCGYQQLPWMANIGGVGVWGQSGSSRDSFAGFGLTNTHNPWVTQKDGLLLAVYSTPSVLCSSFGFGALLSHRVRVFWPSAAFDEVFEDVFDSRTDDGHDDEESASGRQNTRCMHGQKVAGGAWWVGRRGSIFVGIMCSSDTKVDTRSSSESSIWISEAEKPIVATRRICESYKNAWVVKVATRDEFPSLIAFRSYCAYRISLQWEEPLDEGGAGWMTTVLSHVGMSSSSVGPHDHDSAMLRKISISVIESFAECASDESCVHADSVKLLNVEVPSGK